MSSDNYFGYSGHQWDRMVDAGLEFLESLAERGGHTDYTSFCRQVRTKADVALEPGDHALSHLLGAIARRSYDSRGVVVTALVHYKDQGFDPGPGFYGICQQLGLLPSGGLSDDTKLVFLARHQTDLERAYRRARRDKTTQRNES